MHSGNTLEVDVSDVMALDQLMSLFSPRKAIKKCYPNFFEKYSVCHIHTCHELEFDLGRSSTRYPSGLHKKINTWKRTHPGRAADVFPQKLDEFPVRMRCATNIECIRHTNIRARLLKKRFLSARSMPANIKLKKMCGIFFS